MPSEVTEHFEPMRTGAVVAATRDRLRGWVLGGRYAANGRLPGERRLSEQLRVSRGTVRAALQYLAADGLIRPAPQSGWFIAQGPLEEPPHTLISFTEMAQARGLEPATRVVGHTVRGVSLAEADDLHVSPTTEVLELHRVRSLSGAPVCFDRSVVSLERVPGLDLAELSDRSLFAEIERLGVRPARSDFTLQACAADAGTAAALLIAEGTPVLMGVEVCTTQDGAPILLGRSIYRGDAYRFSATLFRRAQAAAQREPTFAGTPAAGPNRSAP